MKKVICFLLAAIFAVTLCSCAKEEVNSATDKEMIVQMFSDLSNKNFQQIASKSVLKDGSNVSAEDIQSIYDFLVESGVDPALGFSIDKYSKNVGINASAESTSRTYEITALCGDKPVRFSITINRTDKGTFFTQIYTKGVVTDTTEAAKETE